MQNPPLIILRFLIRIYIFWLLLFLLFRMLFLLQLYLNHVKFSFIEILQSNFFSLRLDISTASYLIVLPFLLIVAFQFLGKKIFIKIISFYHYIFIPVCIALLLANIKVYESWGTILSRRAVAFLEDPKEVAASLSAVQLLMFIGLFILFLAFMLFLFKKIVSDRITFSKGNYSGKIVATLLSALLIFLGIRGGWQLIPVNESAAYFSSRTVLNHASTNAIWHLANNLSKSSLNDKNPYQRFTDSQCQKLLSEIYTSKHESAEAVKSESKPNIIIILLESWTADVIEPLDGDKNVTPFFTSLCDSGLLFTNIYATGRRTDQALPSLLSGFPAQPDHSIIRFTDKTEYLPYLPRYFKQNGYNLSFFYGGELGFANMHSYLLYAGFDKFVSKDDFPSKSMNSKWGAHDEFVLSRQLSDLKQIRQPFFSLLLTLSSHEPYEIPRPDLIKGNDTPAKFRNAAKYTDECLREYFAVAQKQSWFSNTLFILVADHGHIEPRERDYYDIRTHQIPLLFYGPALNNNFKGKKINVTGNQNDLAATLLNQFKWDATPFLWSNDLLNNIRINFAYVDFDESFGWVTDNGSFLLNSASTKTDKIVGNQPDSNSIKWSVAYRQQLYKEFLELGNK